MRTSEYYAQGIHGFFVGYALDALDQNRRADEAPAEEPEPEAPEYDMDAAFVKCTGCFCHTTAYPPCMHCEDGHDDEREVQA
ncbi:hypothetical protein Caci_2988 [Catenulispora acidiphila DSM 44928]|uniref:Uncharacterized protein n=1 Tax=Catenulispora acidiphila (strain DSM 44928 / JCM 14897 / NBRC 102108 / NRRL B-24433 / ID139908) TaxID=479433 RepID=C7Q305_CATAD|nr:hypothetical protein [Catenulispora acidiphila]ACU71897.1 hypothetical protein Caci_2988 [Catenulispora acidiphila DSM 44928]